ERRPPGGRGPRGRPPRDAALGRRFADLARLARRRRRPLPCRDRTHADRAGGRSRGRPTRTRAVGHTLQLTMGFDTWNAGCEVVPTNGIELKVHVAGSGPAALLCHGFPELGFSWRHQVGPLVDAGFRVLVPDLRGFGGSPGPEG